MRSQNNPHLAGGERTQAEERAIAAENEVTDMHRRVESLKEENKEQLKELMAQREDRGADLANKTMEIERLQLHKIVPVGDMASL